MSFENKSEAVKSKGKSEASVQSRSQDSGNQFWPLRGRSPNGRQSEEVQMGNPDWSRNSGSSFTARGDMLELLASGARMGSGL